VTSIAVSRKRPVLVLGGTGFVGSHLTTALRLKGTEVVVISAPTPELREDLERRIARAIRGRRPSTVFNLLGSGAPAPRDESDYHEVRNAGAARSVAAAVRSADFDGTLVFTSTGAVYGNTPAAASEGAPLRPITAHARSKLDAEQILLEAAPYVIVARLFQVFGEGQRKLVVHDLARRIHREEGPLRLRSTGAETRDLAYVSDVVAALCALAAAGKALTPGAHVFNVASGVGIRIDELARRLLHLADQGHRLVVPGSDACENPLAASLGDPAKLIQFGVVVPPPSDATLLRTLNWTAANAD
jgi:nucleoside-diphosphate-sugar epimerase